MNLLLLGLFFSTILNAKDIEINNNKICFIKLTNNYGNDSLIRADQFLLMNHLSGVGSKTTEINMNYNPNKINVRQTPLEILDIIKRECGK